MRSAWLAILFLCSLSAAEERWWQDLFLAEDAPSPPRAEVTDPLVLDRRLDRNVERYQSLLWMATVARQDDLGMAFARERDLSHQKEDVTTALLPRRPARGAGWGAFGTRSVFGGSPVHGMKEIAQTESGLEEIQILVTRYQESQGLRPKEMVIGQTMVMQAAFDTGEPVLRWVGRNLLPLLPDMVVEWGRDVDLTKRFSWSFERRSFSGEPTLLDRHVEESVKQVDVRVVRGLYVEFGLRRELLNSQPEDDFFEGGSGLSEPFASLMWKF